MQGIYLKLFVDSLEKYKKLSDAEFGRLARAALRYKATGQEARLTGREELLWDGLKLDIDRDNERYAAVSQARSEAGRKGAGRRWHGAGDGNCPLPYAQAGQDQDKDKDQDQDKDKGQDKGRGRPSPPKRPAPGPFTPPAAAEVEAYCRERGNGVDPQRFVDFYASKGWKVGSAPMRDWRAAVRTWEKREADKRGGGCDNGRDYYAVPEGWE